MSQYRKRTRKPCTGPVAVTTALVEQSLQTRRNVLIHARCITAIALTELIIHTLKMSFQ